MRSSRFLVVVVFVSLVTLLLSATASSAQTVTTLYSFNGTNSSQFPIATLVQGRDAKLYGTTSGLTFGSIFRSTTLGATAEIFAFDGADGSTPTAGITLASDGNFYGTAFTGGSAQDGVLFRITPGGTYSVLHEFAGTDDGAFPFAAPIQASDGNLYGSTRGFGTASTIYEYNPVSGVFSTVSQLDAAQGEAIIAPLIQGSDGNLYGTAQGGGAFDCGTVFKMNRSGVVLLYYSFPCGAGGALPSGPLVQASDGNFYGTTFEGGSGSGQGHGTIFRMNQKGQVSILYRFQGGPTDGNSVDAGLVQSTDGNLYGTTAGGGSSGFGTLYQITTGSVYKLLYNFPANTGPEAGLLQHTNGSFYGTTNEGGPNGYGTIYSLNMGIGSFVTFVRPTGGAGQTAQILGQGFTSTTAVTFNGLAAASFKVLTDTYMTAVVPSGATTGKVVVTTPGGPLTSNVNFRILQ